MVRQSIRLREVALRQKALELPSSTDLSKAREGARRTFQIRFGSFGPFWQQQLGRNIPSISLALLRLAARTDSGYRSSERFVPLQRSNDCGLGRNTSLPSSVKK